MATFRITDTDSGRTFDIQGETAPTEAEIDELIATTPVNPEQGTQQGGMQFNDMAPPPASYVDTKLTTEGNAAMSASPFLDPSMVTDNAYEESTPPDISLDGLGGATGGIVGGLGAASRAQSVLAPTPWYIRGPGTVLAGAAGAFTAGTAGDLAESGVESYWDMDNAPGSLKEAVTQALKEGGEQAAYDAVGNTVFLGGGSALSALRPHASRLATKVSRLLEEGGSSASLGQLTDNFMYTGLEKLVRGAFVGGGRFTKLDILQDDAVVKYTADYIQNFTKASADNLTDTAFGKLALDTIKGGREAHSGAARQLYEKLDELIPNPRVPTSTTKAPGLNQQLGAPAQVVKGTKERGAVDVRAVKELAREKLAKLKASGDIGKTAEGGELLDKIVGLDDFIGFEAAHNARSDMLFRQRGLSSAKGGDPIAKNITDMVNGVDGAMDVAGKSLNPEGLKAYRNAAKFYRFGKENFNNDLINSIIKKEDVASKIAPAIFKKGNYEEIVALRNAVKEASKLDKSIVFNDVWGKMQGSYLKSLLPTGIDDVLKAPIRTLHKDKALRKTLEATFTKAQREGIVDMSRAIDEILSKRGASGGLINLRQMGQGMQLAGAGFATQGGVSYGEATAILGIPLLFSQIATRPAMVKHFVRWASAKPGTALKVTAVTKLAKELGVQISQLDPTNATGIKETEGKPE